MPADFSVAGVLDKDHHRRIDWRSMLLPSTENGLLARKLCTLTEEGGGIPLATHLGLVPSRVTLKAPKVALRDSVASLTMT